MMFVTDEPFNDWYFYSDKKLLQHIGDFIKANRVKQKKSQDVLSAEAGISRSTLSLLERGEIVTLATLLQVLRVLQQLHVLDAFKVQEEISPMAMVVAEHPAIYKRLKKGAK
jgi:transcriptional regulator with XRE-family HTH domain